MGYMLESTEVPRPKNEDDKHIFKLTLSVIAPSHLTPDEVWLLAAAGIAKGGIDVVAGYGAEVLNVTSTQKDGTEMKNPSKMILTGFKNQQIPKGMEKIPVLRVKKTRIRKKKG